MEDPSTVPDARTPWQVVAGIVAAVAGTIVAFAMVGSMISVRILLSMGEPEQDALLGPSLLLLTAAVLAVVAIVATIHGRGWSRPALLCVAAATVVAALLVGQAWIGAVPIVAGAILLWLPPSRRWFADRAATRTAAARTAAAPLPPG